jgi:parallel beta-helix repeat protein
MLGLVFVAFLLCILLCNPEERSHAGQTIHVPDDYSTIRAAINASSSGDTIIVGDGTYTGTMNKNLSFNGKAITVKSENGPQNCVIDCEGSGRGFYLNYSEGSDSVIHGFTIKNADTNYNGGGIYLSHSDPTIKNCIIDNCDGGTYGGGIYCYNSEATILDSTIVGCTGTDSGGGIYCYYADPTIKNCTIKDNNTTFYGHGGGICCLQSDPTLENCVIIGNNAEKDGGGIYCKSMSSPTLKNCLIADNTAKHTGGGVHCWQYSNATLINCTIAGNTVTNWYGGGIHCSYSTVTAKNTVVWGNSAGSTGHQVYTMSSSTVNLNYGCYANGTGDIDGNGTFNPSSCTTSDPLLVGDGDYHIQAGSSCIDTGDNTVASGDYDWDGNARILDGNKDETDTVDIGFYEAHPDWSPDMAVIEAPNLDLIAPVPLGFTYEGSFYAYSASNETIYWYRKDGSVWLDPIVVEEDVSGIVQIVVGDGTNNGLPDLFALAPETASVHWYENLGNPAFSPHYVLSGCATKVKCILPLDLNGDGYSDVIMSEEDMILVCMNDGEAAPEYGGKEILTSGVVFEGKIFLAGGNFGGDSYQDLICARSGGELTLMCNVAGETGRALEARVLDHAMPEELCGLIAFDANGDGTVDFGTIEQHSPAALTLNINDGGLDLVATGDNLGVHQALQVSPAVVDTGNQQDLMILNAAGTQVTWYRNLSPYLPPAEDAEIAYAQKTVQPTYT